MLSHSLPKRPALGRRLWRVAPALVVVLGAAAYGYNAPPATAPAASANGVAAPDPTMQSFLGYLRSHSGSRPPARPISTPAEPGQQAVMRYLDAHTSPTPAPLSAWEAVVQAVRNYVRSNDR